jgi:hypothetical protein
MLKWVVIVVWSCEADSGGPEYKISELDCKTACSLKAVISQDPVWHAKPKHVLHSLSSLYMPDDDPDKGRNIVAKAKYIYTW